MKFQFPQHGEQTMRKKLSKLALAATLGLAITFTFSCYLDNSSDDTSYDYCITADNKCLTGPFTASTCSGQVSNTCPYGSSSSNGKSSSSLVLSSSSNSDVSSSSSSKQSSSSIPSSSSRITSSSSFVPSSSSSSSVQSGVVYGTPVTYQGETYKTVVIGTQTWMASNLNYEAKGSVCYKNSEDSCTVYGRLYDWATAMDIDEKYNKEEWRESDVKHQGICPDGWHIPSDTGWATLINFVGGSSTAGTKLKTASEWSDNGEKSGNGTDDYGFAALPSGTGYFDGSFNNVGKEARWWSSSNDNATGAWNRGMSYKNENVYRYGSSKRQNTYSVRCLKDD
jgi:uncharacterized protein (TIGR02145 family)